MTRNLAVVFFGLSVLGITLPLFGEEGTKQPARATSTEKVNFAPGGTIRLIDSFGYLTVEGWDRPEVEITATKSIETYYEPEERERAAQRLERIHIVAERRSGTELAVSTTLPSRSRLLPPPWRRNTKGGVTVEYQIHVPRDSRLVIHHGGGYVLVSNITGDVEATSSSGDIVLMLPDPGKYSIDAKTKLGKVVSDFGSSARRRYKVGEKLASTSLPPSRRVYARMGRGSITIKEAPREAPAPAGW
jgi:hypothetical protein